MSWQWNKNLVETWQWKETLTKGNTTYRIEAEKLPGKRIRVMVGIRSLGVYEDDAEARAAIDADARANIAP